MKNIMLRIGKDDFDAMLIAQAMTDAGAEVFSITYSGMNRPFGVSVDVPKFIVWAKTRDDAHIDEVDEAISSIKEQKNG